MPAEPRQTVVTAGVTRLNVREKPNQQGKAPRHRALLAQPYVGGPGQEKAFEPSRRSTGG